MYIRMNDPLLVLICFDLFWFVVICSVLVCSDLICSDLKLPQQHKIKHQHYRCVCKTKIGIAMYNSKHEQCNVIKLVCHATSLDEKSDNRFQTNANIKCKVSKIFHMYSFIQPSNHPTINCIYLFFHVLNVRYT